MLQKLSIQNYALIKDITIEFKNGFSVITGETGAGKSVLMGALSLLAGERADTSVLFDKQQKCVVEGTFHINTFHLESFFKEHDLEFDNCTIIRREIADNGRSRAFINDTPVSIGILKSIGDRLLDIHSQHDNLFLNDPQFRFDFLDSISGNEDILEKYRQLLKYYLQQKSNLDAIHKQLHQSQSEFDFLNFQLNELNEAKLRENEMEELEIHLKTLSHSEEINHALQFSLFTLENEQSGSLVKIKEILLHLQKIKDISSNINNIFQRTDALYIELKDIAQEINHSKDKVESDPDLLEKYRKRTDLLYGLLQKYKCQQVSGLIKIRDEISEKVLQIEHSDENIEKIKKELDEKRIQLTELASKISKIRKEKAKETEAIISLILKDLGMPHAKFNILFEHDQHFNQNGSDILTFHFSANKNIAPQDITKIASGGELSRLMLSIKMIVSSAIALPTLILDEIDTGVSGEIADKMAEMMKKMALSMQLISITHLPQVAAKGSYHYMVSKKENQETVEIQIKALTHDERVREIAKMLSGKGLTQSALDNAVDLLR